jgi:hypothetical protein
MAPRTITDTGLFLMNGLKISASIATTSTTILTNGNALYHYR